MHHVLTRISVQPAAAGVVHDALVALAAKSRTDDGCGSFVLYQQAAAPHMFHIVEEWADKAAFDAHMASAHVTGTMAAASAALTAPPEMMACNLI